MVDKTVNSWNRFSLTPYGQQLVADNIRLAYAFAARVPRPIGLDQDEYESEMLAALVRSACLFNGSLGHLFSTFSWYGMKLWRRELVRRCVRAEKVKFRDPESFMFRALADASRTSSVDDEEVFALLLERSLSVHDGNLLVAKAAEGVGIRVLAKKMGISKERVRQRLVAASSRVRAKF